MGTKVKGFFKGLKNIHIFDEEEPEIQIGMPTDVKHVAHIGADGPATESPSWMKGYDGGESRLGSVESADIKKGMKNHRSTRSEELTRDLSDVPKNPRHRHHRSMDNSMDPDSQSSTKPKQRRHHRIRRTHKKGDLPDLPKKSRQRKPKDDDGSS
ncbi:hypothetical protein SSX86_004342 [Deinandra increscens subsp. villosa]|uniref:CRIB domain-containing protein n=1 Tax=Deinandra increscens subsp. villosa TaxID=3103831 RepID=A0AAP0DNE9_9ASTR